MVAQTQINQMQNELSVKSSENKTITHIHDETNPAQYKCKDLASKTDV